MNTSQALLLPRVESVFNLYSATRMYHDAMFSQHDGQVAEGSLERGVHSTQMHQADGRSALGAFNIGLPLFVRSSPAEWVAQSPNFKKPLIRAHTLMFESYVSTRGCLNMVAQEGDSRFLRMWSRKQWIEAFQKHGFVPASCASWVGHQACRVMQPGLPPSVGLSVLDEGISFALCDIFHASMWVGDSMCQDISL